MKKKKIKKIKKMINKFALVDDIQHLHERIDALEKVKVDSSNKHLQELDGVIKDLLDSDNKFLDRISRIEEKEQILMGRTSVHYDTYSDSNDGITFENCYQILKCMKDRGAIIEEVDDVKNYFNKYIFRCRMFKTEAKDDKTIKPG